MEFSDIGEHCSDPTCKQQDYLPFKCDVCDKYYCLNHRKHGCEDKNNNVIVINNDKKVKLPVCSQKRCKECILVDNICGQCNKNYCIKHRFHGCEEKKIIKEEKKVSKRNRFYKIFNLF